MLFEFKTEKVKIESHFVCLQIVHRHYQFSHFTFYSFFATTATVVEQNLIFLVQKSILFWGFSTKIISFSSCFSIMNSLKICHSRRLVKGI